MSLPIMLLVWIMMTFNEYDKMDDNNHLIYELTHSLHWHFYLYPNLSSFFLALPPLTQHRSFTKTCHFSMYARRAGGLEAGEELILFYRCYLFAGNLFWWEEALKMKILSILWNKILAQKRKVVRNSIRKQNSVDNSEINGKILLSEPRHAK